MIRLTEIEGRKVEYLIKGNGEKTVAIMVGMGCSIYDWLNIIEDISQCKRLVNNKGTVHNYIINRLYYL